MKHDFLKIDTTTNDPLELALWNAYEYEYDDRLASRFKWEDDGRDYITAFNTSFTLLLNNKGMVVLRDMLRKVELFCIRKNAAVLKLMLSDLLGDKFEELQLEKGQQEELTLRAQEVLEHLFKDRYARIYDQLCTLAITSHLYSSGYEFYSRDLATKLLNHNGPKTASHLIMMLAASGRVNAQLLLLQIPYDPIDPNDPDDASLANIMSAINYRLANYLVDSATDNYLFELQSTSLAESQSSQPVLSLVDQTTCPPRQLPEIVAARAEPPRLLPSVERAAEQTIALIPPTIDERIIQHESTELSELRTKAELLEAKLKEAERQLAATTHDLHLQQKAARHQKYLNSILNQQLAQKEALRADSSAFPVDVTVTRNSTKRQSADPIHDLLNQVVAAKLTPAESLTTIDKLLTNHVSILPSAYKSAKESENFRDRKGCFKLLWRLATDYRTALLTGSGDAEARKVFSYNEFASNDGEAEDRRKSQQLRFEYNGRIIQFSKHLKLGFKKSNAETIRIYFDYDALEQKIIIAYCGPHL